MTTGACSMLCAAIKQFSKAQAGVQFVYKLEESKTPVSGFTWGCHTAKRIETHHSFNSAISFKFISFIGNYLLYKTWYWGLWKDNHVGTRRSIWNISPGTDYRQGLWQPVAVKGSVIQCNRSMYKWNISNRYNVRPVQRILICKQAIGVVVLNFLSKFERKLSATKAATAKGRSKPPILEQYAHASSLPR